MVGGWRRILVIEDDAGTSEQLVECLATKGYQIDLAIDGTERLSRARMCEYAVMIIDLLPRLDGIAIIRRLREGGVATPVLMIGGRGRRLRRAGGMAAS